MVNQSAESEIKIIGDDLCKLADLLITDGICTNTGSLEAAGNSCSKMATETNWGYKFFNLDFNIDEVRSRIPSFCTDLILRFSIDIEGVVQKEKEISNPLNKLFFDIEITGSYLDEKEDKVIPLHCSWHFDKHLKEEGDGSPKYSHPEYHIAFGGKKMEGREIYGSTLILPSPRIAYPPMDGPLGVNFILQNYYHKDRIKNILTNPLYMQIIEKSQNRLILPYAQSLISKWINIGEVVKDDFNYKSVFPLFM
jgi:hypothetical protein